MSKRSCALVCACGLVLGACGPDSKPLPAQPDGIRPPVPLAPTPAPPGATTFTVSGAVLEYTLSGVRLQPGVPVRVRVWGRTPMLLDDVSDSTGRYEISGVPAEMAITIAPPAGSDYRAPCPSGSDIGVRGNVNFDVNVVSTALLSTSGAPASLPRDSALRIEGRVSERVSDRVVPVAGATVDLAGDATDRWVFSTTLTDAIGRYMVCTAPPRVGTDQVHTVIAQKDGYLPASREGFPGYDTINLEIVRK